jgi:hypothetical protein
MDVANYIRLLEEENRNLKNELFALRATISLLPPSSEIAQPLSALNQPAQNVIAPTFHVSAPAVGPATEPAVNNTHVPGSAIGDVPGIVPYNKLLKSLYPAINSMHPRQRETTDASVRGFLSAHMGEVPEINGRPAVPKELAQHFIAWFVSQNDQEQDKVALRGSVRPDLGHGVPSSELRSRLGAKGASRGSSGPGRKVSGKDGPGKGNDAAVAAVAWTDFIRYKLPGMELRATHCSFTKKFCTDHRATDLIVRAQSGQMTQAIPVHLADSYLAAFVARYKTNEGEGESCAESSSDYSPQSSSSLRTAKRIRSASTTTGSYWTDTARVYDRAWFDSLEKTERERLRGKLQNILMENNCWNGGFYVPAHLQHVFMSEIAHFRRSPLTGEGNAETNVREGEGQRGGVREQAAGGEGQEEEEEVVQEGSVIAKV